MHMETNSCNSTLCVCMQFKYSTDTEKPKAHVKVTRDESTMMKNIYLCCIIEKSANIQYVKIFIYTQTNLPKKATV